MVKRHIVKVRKNIAALRQKYGWKWKLGVFLSGAILAIGAIFWLALPLPQNYETEIRVAAASYSAAPQNIAHRAESGTRVEIKFNPDQPALNPLPAHSIEEIASRAVTRVIFDKISKIDGEFDYGQVAANPLIESLEYKIEGDRLILDISRKGPHSPAKIENENNIVAVVLAAADPGYPQISNQKPANDSIVYPMRHTISFEAVLQAPLAGATIFFQNKPVEFRTEKIAPNEYLFAFEQDIEIDKEYNIKTIITGENRKTGVASWNFVGQIPSAAILGKDRFKYLGWWGQINANGVSVRQSPAASSERLGSLSTANRVKVIEEVFGQPVDGKSLWYRIDGGMYAGAYIFSDFVTPMAQPEPPAEVAIPEEVRDGEKWLDVDLSKKIMVLFDYDRPVFATYISPGREENPTKPGVCRVWYKLVKDDMQGGPPLHSYSYHLKDIPWVMYYNYDYAIHGTYWHDRFGTPQSAGCTNMTQGDAKFIFENILPEIPAGKEEVFAREKPGVGRGTGTVVHNHY